MDCLGTCFTHVQTRDDVRVQSALEWTASVHTSHMSKPVMRLVLRDTEWTASVHILTHVQTCDDVRVQSATERTASVHTSHMSKPVMTIVFQVLQNGLLQYVLHTCPNL